jgi:hypothetical protein
MVTPEQISAAVADAIGSKKEQLLEDRWAYDSIADLDSCGVGVVVTPEQIRAAVADAIGSKKAQLLEDRRACYARIHVELPPVAVGEFQTNVLLACVVSDCHYSICNSI